MKTKIKLIRRFFTVLFVVSLLMACSKDGTQGSIGPQGEDGEQGLPGQMGPQGEPGQDGQDGAQGEPGTANVIYSEWFPSEFPDDIPLSQDDFIVEAPDLTDEILENGILLVFGRTINVIDAELVKQLPHIISFRNQYYYFRYISNPGITNSQQFFIIVESMDSGFIGTPFFDEYRYFIIPGGIPAGGKSAFLDYTKMTYEELIEHFNIPE